MTMLDIHAEAVDGENAAYHEFLLHYKVDANVVYGFVEGKDDPMFYRGLIEQRLPDGWAVELVRSGNKNNVLKVLGIMDWSRFSSKQVCFFADRDLSEFLEKNVHHFDNLYVTDNYSIENEVASFRTLRLVLEEVLNIKKLTASEETQLKNLFEINLALFQEEMTAVMVQILFWQRNGMRACLDNIKPKTFFMFADGRIILRPEFDTITSRLDHCKAVVNGIKSPEDDLAKIEVEFRSKQGPKKYVRGKYILWFFVECALEFRRSIPKLFSRHTVMSKPRLQLGPQNAMVVIGPRLRCPTSLQEFIEKNYLEYVNKAHGNRMIS